MLGTSSRPYINVVHITLLYSLEHLPSQTTYVVRLLDCLGQSNSWPEGLVLNGQPLGLSTSDNKARVGGVV